MATYEITDPKTGRVIELIGDKPPSGDTIRKAFASIGPSSPSSPDSMTKQGFAQNILKDAGQNVQSQAELAAYAFPPIAAMKAMAGQNIYDPKRLQTIGGGVVQGIKETPKRILKSISNPIQTAYEKPISTGLDIATLASLGAGAATSAPVRATGRGIARAAESISGLEYKNPGILKQAAGDSKILFGPGREGGKKFYEAAKNPEANLFEGMTSNKEIVDRAQDVLKAGGKLEPSEAFTARKAVGNLISKKDSVKDVLIPLRNKLDDIAKSDKRIAKGDKITREGIRSEELRRIFPVNKSGGTSIMKSTLATLAGLAPAMAMSPLVQGTVATGVGAVGRALAPIGKAAIPLAAAEGVQALTKNVPTQETPKVLTEKVAKKYLRQAKKNNPNAPIEQVREQARLAAENDGYEIPE